MTPWSTKIGHLQNTICRTLCGRLELLGLLLELSHGCVFILAEAQLAIIHHKWPLVLSSLLASSDWCLGLVFGLFAAIWLLKHVIVQIWWDDLIGGHIQLSFIQIVSHFICNVVKVGIIDVSSRFLDGSLVILCEFMNLCVLRHFACTLLAHGLVLWLRLMSREAALQSLVLGLESTATTLRIRVI